MSFPERFAAQLLCGEPSSSAEQVTERLLAIQAQDPRGARLAVRARSAGLSASNVDAALARRSPFAPLDTPTQEALKTDAADVTRFLGG